MTSELVTNAVRYGTRAEEDESVEVVLWPADGHYWLAFSDPGGARFRAPTPACPGPESETGRGLLLVDSLASAWTVRDRPVRGTSVVAGVPYRRAGWIRPGATRWPGRSSGPASDGVGASLFSAANVGAAR